MDRVSEPFLPAEALRRVARTRGGQQAVWRLYDAGLALMVLIAAGDLPNRWGLTSALWMLIYAAALVRIFSVWPAYFRLLARNWTYLLYPAVCLLSVIWSVSPKTSLVGGIQITMSVLVACYLGWRFEPRKLMILAFSTLFLGSTLSLLNYASGGAIAQPLYSDVGGLLGIYTNKNMLGHYSAMATLLGLTFVMMPHGQIPALLRAAALLAVLLCPIAVMLSKSMTAILLLPLYLGLMLLLNRRRLAGGLRHGSIAALILGIGLAPLLMTLAGFDPLAELFARTGKDATLTGRTELWSIAANEIAKVPLTGYGFQAFWVADRFESLRFQVLSAGATAPTFHNFIADSGIGTGLPGILAIFVLVATSLRRSMHVWRIDGSPLAVACLILVLMPVNTALVEPYLYRQHELMMAWLIMIGVSLGRSRTTPFFTDKFSR